VLSFPQSNTGVLSLLIADQKSANLHCKCSRRPTLRHSSAQAITLLRHARLMHTPTATALLPSWDEVSIWTSKAWDEVSYNPPRTPPNSPTLALPLDLIPPRASRLSRHCKLALLLSPCSSVVQLFNTFGRLYCILSSEQMNQKIKKSKT